MGKTKRRRGRPRIDSGSPLKLLGVKLPVGTLAALQRDAFRRGKRPGTLAREILTMWVKMMPEDLDDEGGYVR